MSKGERGALEKEREEKGIEDRGEQGEKER